MKEKRVNAMVGRKESPIRYTYLFFPLYGEVQDASSLTSSGSTTSSKNSALLKERYQCPERCFSPTFRSQ